MRVTYGYSLRLKLASLRTYASPFSCCSPVYAHQDKSDDAKLGLQSTALSFGVNERRQKRILYALATVTWVQWILAGYNAGLLIPEPSNSLLVETSSLMFVSGVSSAYGHLLWQIRTADFDDPHNLAYRFRSNSVPGGLVFLALIAAGSGGVVVT
jgi:4-hydroxybenzoate polyprenyltransferase